MFTLEALLILKNTLISKKKNCFIKKNINNKSLLGSLCVTGLITFSEENLVYKVTVAEGCLKDGAALNIILRKSKKQVWSYKKVFKDTQNTSTIYLFETSYGFLTQNIMLKKRIGGSPICSISF